MLKKIIIPFLLIFCLSGCSHNTTNKIQSENTQNSTNAQITETLETKSCELSTATLQDTFSENTDINNTEIDNTDNTDITKSENTKGNTTESESLEDTTPVAKKANSYIDLNNRFFVKKYPALNYQSLIASDLANKPELIVYGQDAYGFSDYDTQILSNLSERFIYLCDNTEDRLDFEIGDWCFQSTAKCFELIDKWNKKSQVIDAQVCDVIYTSQTTAEVNVLVYVNDNYTGGDTYIDAYSADIANTSGFIAQFSFSLTSSGDWYLYNETYPNFDVKTQYVIRIDNELHITDRN